MSRSLFMLVLAVGVACFAMPANAAIITLNYSAANTAQDDGPQNGTFDTFLAGSLGAVVNNGFGNVRTAFEFDLSGIPAGSTINLATLTINLSNPEGTRSIEVHGYSGDGSIQLADFALNGLVGSSNVGAASYTLPYDVTSLIASLTSSSATFAGFNVREAPAGIYSTVMYLQMADYFPVGQPTLEIDYSPAQTAAVPEPSSVSLFLLGMGMAAGVLAFKRKGRGIVPVNG